MQDAKCRICGLEWEVASWTPQWRNAIQEHFTAHVDQMIREADEFLDSVEPGTD
jgi:hypothetical protein